MRLGTLLLCLLATSCGKSSKGKDGDLCKSDSDCASGVFCSMGTCDRMPCSSTITDDGDEEGPRKVVYERDSAGYVTTRTESRDGNVLVREETGFEDERSTRMQRTFTNGSKTPEFSIRNVHDERGRVIESTMRIFAVDGSSELAFKRSYEFANDACPYAASGTILLSDGSKGTIESACEEGRVVKRVERRGDSGDIARTVTYRYDERGRWIGVNTIMPRGEETRTYGYGMRFIRDGKGRMAEVHVDNDGDGTFESIEKNDFGCFEK